jgi:glyoxylase-like metal-dependent hydrolase (beta-lactamase superfamily II)/rhodanese-related sulfurtransferase
MTDTTMDLEIVVTTGLGNASYLVASGDEAIVVDPPRDAWRVTSRAADRGWRITTVIETHVHNDYLSGALEIRASDGARIVVPARGGFAFDHDGADDGDEIRVGDLRLVARATPGHTPEHLAWDVMPDGSVSPAAVLTGGSLLVGSAGRTDLLGAGRTEELTSDQYRSLQGLAALPDQVAIFPTHGTGSFCAAGPADAARTSTIGTERANNPLLRAPDEAAFRSAMLAGLGPYPTYYAQMAPINRAGPPILGRRPVPASLDPVGFRSAVAGGARVVDARPRRAFADGHIPGSLGVELNETFAAYVGWLLPFGSPIVLVLPEPNDEALVEATEQLIRIGYDVIQGWLVGGVERYAADGGSLDAYPTSTAAAIRRELATGASPLLLDVRDAIELRDEGRIAGAIEIPLGELPARMSEIPSGSPITVLCKSGARASIAASVLDAAGFDVRAVGVGGAPDIGPG